MICVHCASECPDLYTLYSSKNYALCECESCHEYADPYIETDFTVQFIDLLLLKKSVLRHLVFNHDAGLLQGRARKRFLSPVLRLGIAVTIVDAFSVWSNLTLNADHNPTENEMVANFAHIILLQVSEMAGLLAMTVVQAWLLLKLGKRKSASSRLSSYPLAVFYSALPRLCLLFIIFVWRSQYSKSGSSEMLSLFPSQIIAVLPKLNAYEFYLVLVRKGLGSASAILSLMVVTDLNPITCTCVWTSSLIIMQWMMYNIVK